MIFRKNSDASAKLPWDANSVPYSLGPSIAISSRLFSRATRGGRLWRFTSTRLEPASSPNDSAARRVRHDREIDRGIELFLIKEVTGLSAGSTISCALR